MTIDVTPVTSQRGTPTSRAARYPGAAVVVAVASLASAAIHVDVIPEHREEWWLFGAFFTALAVIQVLSAALVLWWPRRSILVGVAALNVGVVLLWLLSRTAGLPIGPPVADFTAGLGDPSKGGYGEHAAGLPEAVGRLDLTSTILELIVVVAVCALLPARIRGRLLNAICLVGVVVWGLFVFDLLG